MFHPRITNTKKPKSSQNHNSIGKVVQTKKHKSRQSRKGKAPSKTLKRIVDSRPKFLQNTPLHAFDDDDDMFGYGTESSLKTRKLNAKQFNFNVALSSKD